MHFPYQPRSAYDADRVQQAIVEARRLRSETWANFFRALFGVNGDRSKAAERQPSPEMSHNQGLRATGA